jgi:hypothetical protein
MFCANSPPTCGYLLLATLSDAAEANPSPDVDSNSYREVLRRLAGYGDTSAYRDLAAYFGTRVNR